MNIFILDQHKIVIDGLMAILQKKKGYSVKGFATNVRDTIEWLNENEVDLLITEAVFCNDDISELLTVLNQQHPHIRILILTGDNRIKRVQELFKIGIHGFIEKQTETKDLFDAINQISNGKHYIGEELRNKIIENFTPSLNVKDKTVSETLNSITNRELEIIQLICEGFNSKEISNKLYISFNTVESHRKRNFQKLKIKNSISLLKFALKHDLIE